MSLTRRALVALLALALLGAGIAPRLEARATGPADQASLIARGPLGVASALTPERVQLKLSLGVPVRRLPVAGTAAPRLAAPGGRAAPARRPVPHARSCTVARAASAVDPAPH